MKKFGSIKMHDANMMSDDEMKRIVGGDLPTTTLTSCTAQCEKGGDVKITNCNGTCIAKNYESVTCVGSGGQKTQTTYCQGKNPHVVL